MATETVLPRALPQLPALLTMAWALIWLLAGWQPLFPQDWALENLLSLLAAWFLVRQYRRRPLSNIAYLLLFVFGSAHEIGSHYTYAEVPYEAWAQGLLGGSPFEWLGWQRNHYDRLVHLLFGLLCYRPLLETLHAPACAVPAHRYLLPLLLVSGISLLYEQIEWIAALLFGGELGQAYLGTQGDSWDAQKDSGLALVGACIAALLQWRVDRHAQTAT